MKYSLNRPCLISLVAIRRWRAAFLHDLKVPEKKIQCAQRCTQRRRRVSLGFPKHPWLPKDVALYELRESLGNYLDQTLHLQYGTDSYAELAIRGESSGYKA
jgi:hypothetical protein